VKVTVRYFYEIRKALMRGITKKFVALLRPWSWHLKMTRTRNVKNREKP
tara:strand:+ start:281 stop:427 length:147 start_codon:yes stop_codon:yes gene_type:complete